MRSLLIITLTLVLIGCGWKRGKDYHLDGDSFDKNTLGLIEQRTGLSLPAASRGLHFFYQGSTIDPSFWAKIEIPSTAHDAIKKEIERIPDKGGGIMNEFVKEAAWWNPVKGTIETERYFHNDMNGVHVLLCKENEGFMLYVVWIKV